MAVLDREIYNLRYEKVGLDDFLKPKRRVLKGKKKKVEEYLYNRLMSLKYRELNFNETFLFNVFLYLYENLDDVYKKDMYKDIHWFDQQLTNPKNNFKLSLIFICKYFVNKRVYEEYEILSDYILSNSERRPFVNTPLYIMDSYNDRMKDIITLMYELSTGNILDDFSIEYMNKSTLLYMVSDNIINHGISKLFSIYLISNPDMDNVDEIFTISRLALDFCKFILNNDDTDYLIDIMI